MGILDSWMAMSAVPQAEGPPTPKEDEAKDAPEKDTGIVVQVGSLEHRQSFAAMVQADLEAAAERKRKKPDTLFHRLDPSNSGVTIQFHQEKHDELPNMTRLVKHDAKPSYHYTIVSEASKMVREPLIVGNRNLRCKLFWLPIQVRFKIYEAFFMHDLSAVEVGRVRSVRLAKLAFLSTCHTIYHECSIALYHCLSYRTLFLRTYGSYSADFFRRIPRPLKCCRCVTHHKYLEYPCRTPPSMWKRSYESIFLLLGSEDFRVALQRRWAFSEFITTLRMREPLKVYSLTVVVNDNWKLRGFDEKDLVKALFSGAFEFLGQLRFRGFNEEERNTLCQLVHGLRIHTVRIERPKKKYQGTGFAIWICEFFFSATLFRLGLDLKTLEYKIYDGEENIPVWLGGF
ncbi:uncharacterized protein KD926_001562 [Aspergillus affinis]|uniref:uncharacterized protein n=1 Tax=Aspergillus affinis TaxID=1070780 RepID=UPI0022FEA9DB|nr:uncharacterized protein KD926_001562 [Aspergillus affinis]KAI9036667.1 hypothetical protein KD926_001562 [Aspergillus affinis]